MNPFICSPKTGDNRTIVFYATDDDVDDVEDAFIDLGFKDVQSYRDSMSDWEDDGGRVELTRFIHFKVIKFVPELWYAGYLPPVRKDS